MLDKLLPIFKSKTNALEMLYLWQDLKPVVRQGYYEGELQKVKEFCEKNKLAIEVSGFKVLQMDKGAYSNKGLKVSKDDPRKGLFFVYISKNPEKASMAEMYEMKNDHRSLGIILGYPKCCVDFYVKNTSEMARGDNDFLRATVKNSRGYSYPFHTNISKRSMDITLISHFPCAFDCLPSIDMGKQNFAFLKQYFPKTAEKVSEEMKGRMLIFDNFFEFS